MGKVQLAYYGDDFTGSTDALESLTLAGLKTILFLDLPSEETLEEYKDYDAIGLAGTTRAMPPDQMKEALVSAFELLKSLEPRHIHYKVCSTFDSSPKIGNIGTAIEAGWEVFGKEITPILAAAPHLGRYTAFGNHYAQVGTAGESEIFRLDRHPSMSQHPTTPALESDLRVHLSEQIDVPMGLVDLTDLEQNKDEITQKVKALKNSGDEIIFFDGMYDHQMAKIGSVLELIANGKGRLFSVGSSGIGKALGDHWQSEGLFSAPKKWEPIKEEEAILVLSGSCSPVTGNQIKWAVQHGFKEIALDPTVLNPDSQSLMISAYANQVSEMLSKGKSVIIHTCSGPDDPRVQQTKIYFHSIGLGNEEIRERTASQYGRVLGAITNIALEKTPINRMVIAGGDTSGSVANELSIKAVEMIAPLYKGAPLCRAKANGSPIDGMEVNIKGGQVGDEAYFEILRKGDIK